MTAEDRIQKAVVQFLALNARPGVVYWHTPNGGSRNPIEAKKLKGMGVRAGMPDIMLLADGKLYALELKTEKGRVSPRQLDVLDDLIDAGAETAVAFGLRDAIEALQRWRLLRRKFEVAA